MNNQIGNRDKRIAVLLIVAFAWLFIGSLIIFHEEHVLGKHMHLASQLFISPKSNDKKDYTSDVHQSFLNVQDNLQTAGIQPGDDLSDVMVTSFEFLSDKASSELPDDVVLRYSSLRAPPVL